MPIRNCLQKKDFVFAGYVDVRAHHHALLVCVARACAVLDVGCYFSHVGFGIYIFFCRNRSLVANVILSSAFLLALGWTNHFWMAILLLIAWGSVFAITMPIRQAYLNAVIPTAERAYDVSNIVLTPRLHSTQLQTRRVLRTRLQKPCGLELYLLRVWDGLALLDWSFGGGKLRKRSVWPTEYT